MIVPGSVNPLLAAQGGDPIDEFGVIARALRLRQPAGAYLSKTFAADGNRTKWTMSMWLKPHEIVAAYRSLFGAASGVGATTEVDFYNGQLMFVWNSYNTVQPAMLFRDLSAFYHVVFIWDSGNATSTDRVRIEVNGVRVTSFTTNNQPGLNTASYFNAGGLPQGLGAYGTSQTAGVTFAHVAFVDGQALDSSYFGRFHPKTGQWRPKSKSSVKAVVDAGSANSFFLDFGDPTNTTTLCADASSKGNNWTANNISLTAGYTYDSLLDTPTTNYCVLNALANGSTTLANGALDITGSTTGAVHGSQIVPRDYPVYWEVENLSTNNASLAIAVGLVRTNVLPSANYQIASVVGITGWYSSNLPYFMKDNGTSQAITGATAQAGDVLQVAVNGNNVWIGRNDTWYDSAGGTTGNPATGANPTYTISSAFDYVPFVHVYANTGRANFGQRAWSKTCPTGFKAINQKNRAFPRVRYAKTVFDVVTWTGDGAATKAISGLQFSPDVLNIKSRSAAAGWGVFDTQRGPTKRLRFDSAAAETTEGLSTFDAFGFTVDKTGGLSNEAAVTYVGHAWKAGGAAVANNVGTIAAQVSANQAAGISTVTWTGTGAAGTIGHGLLDTPKMILVKNKDNVGGSTAGFCMGHASANGSSSPWNYFLQTWTTAGIQAAATPWNNTAPDSSKFTVGNDMGTNYNGAHYIAYVFAEVPGFSKFGDFQGNSSADGTFVNCGFSPKYVLLKDTVGTSFWFEWDTARETYNQMGKVLSLNTTSAETAGTAYNVDFVSNGFKFRWGGGDPNQSGKTYLYAAFAEFPGRYANAR